MVPSSPAFADLLDYSLLCTGCHFAGDTVSCPCYEGQGSRVRHRGSRSMAPRLPGSGSLLWKQLINAQAATLLGAPLCRKAQMQGCNTSNLYYLFLHAAKLRFWVATGTEF